MEKSMEIKELLEKIQKLQNLYPNAQIYFVDGNKQEWFETYFVAFNVDEENNKIEMLFDTEG